MKWLKYRHIWREGAEKTWAWALITLQDVDQERLDSYVTTMVEDLSQDHRLLAPDGYRKCEYEVHDAPPADVLEKIITSMGNQIERLETRRSIYKAMLNDLTA